MLHFRLRSRLLDRLALRIIASPLGLHLFLTAIAAMAVFGCLIGTWNLAEALMLPSTLKTEGRFVDAPLVDRPAWRWNTRHTVLTCYVRPPGDDALPCIITADPGEAASLRVYRHALLTRGDHRSARAVAVPADGNWDAIFLSAEGVTARTKVSFIVASWLFTCLLVSICLRGYMLIKGGSRPRRRRY